MSEPDAGPTLAAIAAELAVSVSTVSKVLNRRGDVGPTTRARVEQALAAQRYQRRRRTVLTPPTPVIDLVVNGLDGSWAASVASGVEATAHQAGFRVAIAVARPAGADGDWIDAAATGRSAGVIAGLVDLGPAEHRRLRQAGLPVVVIDPLGDPPPGVASVGTSNWAGAHEATQFLIDRGHRDIALVAGPADHLYARARVAGYRSALTSAGLPVRQRHIRHGSYDRASGRDQVQAVLATTPRPTAVFVCSDHMAIGGYEAIGAAGLRVPQDISVVGFDDLPEARWVHPHLTTVRQPLKDMAASATGLLIRLIRGETMDSRRLELATTLIERDSTRTLRPARSRG